MNELDIKKIFPQVAQTYEDGKRIIYLDSAATNLKHIDVINSLNDYYKKDCANVHRGIHTLSEKATAKYEQTRKTLKNFINASREEEIVFTKGTTDAINLVARSFGDMIVNEGDEIIISELEHHSNIVPWQMLCERTGAVLKVIPVNDDGELLIEEYKKLLSTNTKIVAINYISNALGTINPVSEIIDLAKSNGSYTLIDAAQAMAHTVVDVQKLDCDFLCFSAHKMFGPTGVGALYAKHEHLEKMPPLFGGGDMIDTVTFVKTTYNIPPQKFEAGTPAIAEVIAWKPALDFINELSLDYINGYESEILAYATEKLTSLKGLKIIGNAKKKACVISFIIDGLHPHDIATLANKYRLALRTGHHCTQPLMRRMNVPATARASFSIYNTKEDVDHLYESLKKIIELFS